MEDKPSESDEEQFVDPKFVNETQIEEPEELGSDTLDVSHPSPSQATKFLKEAWPTWKIFILGKNSITLIMKKILSIWSLTKGKGNKLRNLRSMELDPRLVNLIMAHEVPLLEY